LTGAKVSCPRRQGAEVQGARIAWKPRRKARAARRKTRTTRPRTTTKRAARSAARGGEGSAKARNGARGSRSLPEPGAQSGARDRASVLDRTGVIVDIFHRHAGAARRVCRWRSRGSTTWFRASANQSARERAATRTRAGEAALELDRQGCAIASPSSRGARAIQKQQVNRRAARRDQLRVALVGYTNAGKIFLIARATGSEVLVADKLFATLDTTVPGAAPGDQAAAPGVTPWLHQEGCPRSGRVVPFPPGRSARSFAPALRGRRIGSHA